MVCQDSYFKIWFRDDKKLLKLTELDTQQAS